MTHENSSFSQLPILRKVIGHHHDVPFFVTEDMFGGVPFEIAGGDISNLVGTPVAATHEHTIDEIYFLISANPGDAVIEVEIDGVSKSYTSPSVIHVPANTPHRFITKAAKSGSYCFGILYKSRSEALG